jgi:hypothetical protein
MEMQKQGKDGWAREAQYRRIMPPPPVHQGVGDALRASYELRACEIPSDFAALLAKLS